MNNLIDAIVEYIAPERAIKRRHAREVLRSYDGGKLDRRTQAWNVGTESGDTSNITEVTRLRARSWDLYRNNPQARKIVNAIVAQVVGTGIKPESQAINPDGTPDEEFRRKANEIWQAWEWYSDGSGAPGRGGLVFSELCQQALREVILSGEVLVEELLLTRRQQRRRMSPIPFSLNLVVSERLADDQFGLASNSVGTGNKVFRGIEVNERGERVNYWLYDEHPNDSKWWTERYEATPYTADRFLHVYIHDRPGQMRGVPWFAPVVLELRDVGDLKQNELLASALRACVTMAIRKTNPGSAGSLLGPTNADTTDSSGNAIRRLQPGTLMQLGPGEDLVGTSGNGPNIATEGFATFMTGNIASGMPGLKSSTVTGDYRNSSFSSERSADNDVWREIQILQDWLANQFLQPIFDRVIEAAVDAGELGDSESYYAAPDNYTACTWQGPVPKSINPVDDANASMLLIQGGLDSLQNRSSANGTKWRENLRAMNEVYTFAESQGIDEKMIDKIYGLVAPPEKSTDDKENEDEDQEADSATEA